VLLGIWAVQGTIALRNALLGVGGAISIVYSYRFLKLNTHNIPFKTWAPLILIGLMFFWVILHYLFLSQYPAEQFGELRSTWLRSLLGAALGFGTALAITYNYQKANLILLGLFTPFLLVFLWWIISEHFALHRSLRWLSAYSMFGPKPNALVGGIPLFAWSCAFFLQEKELIKTNQSISNRYFEVFLLTVIAVILFDYLIIFQSHIGLVLCIFIVIATIAIYFYRRRFFKINIANTPKTLIAMLLIVAIVGITQFMRDPLWKNLIEDFSIAVQTDKYQNWRNLALYQYPKRGNGESVSWNVYERVAWSKVGIEQIPKNPVGEGVLYFALGRAMDKIQPKFERIEGVFPQSSHSAWIEITLAFGLPILALLWSIIFLNCFNKRYFGFKGLVLLGSGSILVLYGVAELSNGHAIESLIFWLTFLSAVGAGKKIKY
jgi:hypothetical protein